MKIGIIVAMDKELTQLKAILSSIQTERFNNKDFIIGALNDKKIILQQCGIGKVNSAVGTVEMINNYHPDLIISSGCAGGVDVSLEVAQVVVAKECVYHDAYCGDEQLFGQIMGMPARFKTSQEYIDKALALNDIKGKIPTIKAGLTVSGEWFVNTKDKMQSIINHFPDAKAVDMESCSIAQVCYIYGVPFVSFRVISDIPLKDTNASQYFNFWEKIAEGSFEVTKHFLNIL